MRSSYSRKWVRRSVPKLLALERRDVPASISGVKYEDLNADNVRQAGEPGLPNLVIELQDLATNVTTQVKTDVNGAYTFTNVKPGTYRLLDQPDPLGVFIPSSTDLVIRQVLSNSDVITGVNFGVYRLAKVSGTAFDDLNANGVNDADPPIAGATVYLDTNGNGILDGTEQFTTTNPAGAYTLGGLKPGNYRVTLDTRFGEVSTTPPAVDVTLISNEVRGGVDFGSYALAGVAGLVFNDANANGKRDAGEAPLGNLTVYVDANNDGALNPGERTAKTQADGMYQITALGPEPVLLRLNLSSAFLQTSGPSGELVLESGETRPNQDFGVLRAGRIGGELFDDIDGDGERDDDEPGLVGFGFELYDAASDLVATTVTDFTGRFTFLNLNGGVYLVRQTPNELYEQTTTDPDFLSLGESDQIDDLLFGNFRRVTISGFVFNDQTANGVRGDDPGAFGFNLQLLNLTTGETRQAATDLAGNYRFGDTGPGNYRVQLLARDGWQPTTVTSSDVTVGPLDAKLKGYDFGAFEFAKIGGQVFEDRNRNKALDPDDLPLGGFTVFLDINNDGERDLDDPATVSGADGRYEFNQLAPGVYRVRLVGQQGFSPTTTPPQELTLLSGGSDSVDFGNERVTSVSGSVFIDADGNGIRDDGEDGLAGWNIRLSDAISGAIVTTVASGDDGTFLFEGVAPGSYRVRAVVQNGWLQTTDEPLDFVLGSVPVTGVASFGNFQLAAISGKVFEDANGNGAFDTGEPPLPGQAVFSDANNNGVPDAGERLLLTDDNGNYSFGDLTPGNYRVRQVLPSGSVLTTPEPGLITPTSGQVVAGVDFGNFRPASVGGTVFLDRNGNGVRDASEPGLAGVSLNLVPVGEVVIGIVFTAVTDANGNYAISNLAAGDYRLTQAPLPGFTPTVPADGYSLTLVSGQSLTGQNFANTGRSLIVAGRDQGSRPEVALYSADGGELVTAFDAYDSAFRGGVRVAQGRFGGGTDVVTAPGPGGGPDVRIFDAASGLLKRSFFAYGDRFVGGVFVAVGDVTGDGIDDIITGADAGGGPHVRVFDGANGLPITDIFPYAEGFTGGVRVAAGDVNGDGRADVITAAGSGGGPHVRVFDGLSGQLISEFFAFAVGFTGGVFVSAGDSDGDGRAEVFAGAGAGGGPNVRVFDGQRGEVISDLFAYSLGFNGGVRVGAADVNFDGRVDLVTAPGRGSAGTLKAFDGRTGRELTSFGAFDPSFLGGVFVG